MNLYEHTIIARQDVSPSQLKQIEDKYTKIVDKFEGNIVKSFNIDDADINNVGLAMAGIVE